MALVGWISDLHQIFYLLLVAGAAFIAAQLALWKIDESG